MDTFEARVRMRELACDAIETLRSYLAGDTPGGTASRSVRAEVGEARSLLTDAGYPGEAVWRCLHRAVVGFDLPLDPPDAGYWDEVLEDLASAAETLDSLTSTGAGRDVDFRIID